LWHVSDRRSTWNLIGPASGAEAMTQVG
jgi:hypothetical protein